MDPLKYINKMIDMYEGEGPRITARDGGSMPEHLTKMEPKIDDAFWINHYSQVLDARLGAMEEVKNRGGPLNPDDAKYIFKQYNELKKYGGDTTEFDQRIRNLSPPAEEPRITAQAPRIGLKPGGIVEPGVTHYAILTEAEKSKIRTGKITKEPRGYELMEEKSWKKITDRIKNLRLQKNNRGLTNEAFAKKLNDVYKIKTRTGTTWDKSLLAQLQQGLEISQEVATKVKRPLSEVKKIIKTLKTGEQILEEFDAGKISEFQLRKKATDKIYMEEPETKIRIKKWKKENPEKVRAMEERKQLKTWYKEKRAFPRIPKNAKSNIWANLHENVRKKRGRIELIDDNVIYEKNGTIKWSREGKNGKPNWQNVKFKDTVKNAVFTWDNLEKKVDNVFGENAYKKFAFPYEARNQLTEATITYKGEERSVGSVLNESLLKKHYKTHARPGETYDAFKKRRAKSFGAFEANHMYANDPWQTQLTFRDSNRELSYLDDTFQKELRMAVDDPQKIKSLTKNFINEVKTLPGGIEWNIGDQMIGKKPSIGSVTQAAFGETGLIRTFEANPQFKKNLKSLVEKIGCPDFAAGGRVGFADGKNCFDKGLKNIKNKNFKTKGQADNMLKLAETGAKSARLRALLGVWGLGGEVIIEAGIGSYKVLGKGVPAKIAWAESYWSYLDPRKYTGELSDLRKKDLEKSNPRIAKYFDALGVLEKRNTLKRRVEADDPQNPYIEMQQKQLDQYDEIIRNFYGGPKGLTKMMEKIQPEVDEAEAIQAGRWAGEKEEKYGWLWSDRQREIKADRKQKQAMKELMESKGVKTMPYTKDGKPVYKVDKARIDERLKIFGDFMGFGWTPYGLGFGMSNGKYNEDLGYRQVAEGMADSEARDRIVEAGGISKLAGGGLANLTRTVAPDSGPMSHGLRSLYIDDKDY